jgi:hypothetical protein
VELTPVADDPPGAAVVDDPATAEVVEEVLCADLVDELHAVNPKVNIPTIDRHRATRCRGAERIVPLFRRRSGNMMWWWILLS